MTRLDAQILARTMPAAAINCDEFEAYLTDYLDGFLPSNVFPSMGTARRALR